MTLSARAPLGSALESSLAAAKESEAGVVLLLEDAQAELAEMTADKDAMQAVFNAQSAEVVRLERFVVELRAEDSENSATMEEAAVRLAAAHR